MYLEPEVIASAALPERGYRRRIRGNLKKYRSETGYGGTRLGRACLDLVRNDDQQLLGDFQDIRRLSRTLDYWCQEDGDIKDARVFLLVEELLRRTTDSSSEQLSVRNQIISIGRGFSRFFAGRPAAPQLPAAASSRLTTEPKPARPGVYLSTSGSRVVVDPAPEHYFVIIDVGEEDFLIAQHLRCDWKSPQKSPIIREFHVGFLFPQADPPRALLRDPLTLENNILTPSVRVDADAIANEQSQLLDYAWSLSMGADHFDPPSGFFADIWTTTEWQPYRDHIDEIARHRMWDFGITADHSHGPARGSLIETNKSHDAMEPGADIPSFVDLTFGQQVNSFTPLHRAAFEADVEAAAKLLRQGWDPLRADRVGRLPVDFAYASGNRELVSLLEPLTFPH